jgi:hypothetical protein
MAISWVDDGLHFIAMTKPRKPLEMQIAIAFFAKAIDPRHTARHAP